jgi:hypothetical protein
MPILTSNDKDRFNTYNGLEAAKVIYATGEGAGQFNFNCNLT